MTVVRKVIASTAIVLGILLLTAVAAPYLVDGKTVRDQLVAKLSAWADGALRVEGEVHLTSLFDLTIRAQKVEIAEPKRFESVKVIRAETLEARLSVWALLRGRIVFGKVWVQHPVVHLKQPSGLDALPELWRSLVLDDPPRLQRLLAIVQQAPFEYIDFNHARVKAPHLSQADQRLGEFSVTVERQSDPAVVETSGRATWDGQDINFSLTRGTFQPKGPTREASMRLEAESGRWGAIMMDGRIVRSNGARFVGTLDASNVPIRALVHWLDIPVADMFGASRFSASSTVHATDTKIALDKLEAQAGPTRMTGLLSLALDGDTPEVSGTLGLSSVDLTGLGSKPVAHADPPSSRVESPHAQAHRLANWLKGFEADLRLSAEALVFNGMTTGETAAFLSVAGGVATLDVAELMVLGGMMNGQFSGQAKNGGLQVTGKGKADGIDLEALLASAHLPAAGVAGRADISFSLDSTQPIRAEPARDIHLRAEVLALEGGQLPVNLAGLAAQSPRLTGDESADPIGTEIAPGAESYERLRASLRVQDGVLHCEMMEVVQNGWVIRGTGTAAAANGIVDWRFRAAQTGTALAAGAALPDFAEGGAAAEKPIEFRMIGPWQRPRVVYERSGEPMSHVRDARSWWQ